MAEPFGSDFKSTCLGGWSYVGSRSTRARSGSRVGILRQHRDEPCRHSRVHEPDVTAVRLLRPRPSRLRVARSASRKVHRRRSGRSIVITRAEAIESPHPRSTRSSQDLDQTTSDVRYRRSHQAILDTTHQELSSEGHRKVDAVPAPSILGTFWPTVLSPHRPFHLELDQLVHLDGVLHRQLLDQGLDEAADDQGRRLGLGEPAAPQVEELLLADLGDAGLVADLDVVLVDLDVGIGVGPAAPRRGSGRRRRRSTASPWRRRRP